MKYVMKPTRRRRRILLSKILCSEKRAGKKVVDLEIESLFFSKECVIVICYGITAVERWKLLFASVNMEA